MMQVSMQHADDHRMVCCPRKRIQQVAYIMEYNALVMLCHFQRFENFLSVFIVDAPLLCDCRSRKMTWYMVQITKCDIKYRGLNLSKVLSLTWDFSLSTHRCFVYTGNPSSTTRLYVDHDGQVNVDYTRKKTLKMQVSTQHGGGQRMVCYTRKMIYQVAHIMEYDAVVIA